MATPVYKSLVAQALSSTGPLAITGGDVGDDRVYVRTLDYSNDLQYWELRQVRNDGAFAIINKKRGLCIARREDTQGTPLILVGVDQTPYNDLAVWRDDKVAGTYNALNSYKDWEQKINIPGNGPYTDGQALLTWGWSGGAQNELWAKVDDASAVTIKSINFDVTNGNIQDETPLVAGTQTVVNNSSQEQQQTVTFTFAETNSYHFEQTTGLKVTESVEFTAGLPLVGDSKVAITVEGSWTFTDGTEQTHEQQVSYDVPVTVPPHKSIRVSMVALRARSNVPFSAVVSYAVPNGAAVERTVSGMFVGVNGYNLATKFEEIGTVAEARMVRRTPLDRLRPTAPAVPQRPQTNGNAQVRPKQPPVATKAT
jgi:hypothetical protein